MNMYKTTANILNCETLERISFEIKNKTIPAITFFLIKNFFKHLFIFERWREKSVSNGGVEREGDTESEAGSRL